MAPILAAAVGVTPQIIDDDKLRQLRTSLIELKTEIRPQRTYASSDEVPTPQDMDRLIALLGPVQRWVFEEQVSLPGLDIPILFQALFTQSCVLGRPPRVD
jgi:hypothetical protein